MNNNSLPASASRILIVLDAYRSNHGVLEMAASMAVSRQAELVALFIEDMNLIHLAELPFAREFDPVSAKQRTLDSMVVDKMFKRQIGQLQRALTRVTQRFQLSYSFNVMRGHYMAEAVAAATELDILFLARISDVAGAAPTSRVAPGKSAKSGQADDKNVWTIYDGSPASGRALAIAYDLAQQRETGLRILVNITDADHRQTRDRIDEILQYGPHEKEYEVIIPEDSNPYLAIQQSKCCLLVLPRDVLSGLSRSIVTLLEHSSYPIVLTP